MPPQPRGARELVGGDGLCECPRLERAGGIVGEAELIAAVVALMDQGRSWPGPISGCGEALGCHAD
ncbi:hypothetical protein CT676_35980 [Bradyrhizobium sp. MOS001]|uniref:hypothetical protein n=1 Tax=Bradyrhizobium sp. MOS001 TaxID=2133948 RepID=UPI0010756D8E|nr:hypothetical protein [Bradyrhizobium sp. MOS001]TFW56260.1 hypothetical protein CT676_35980 [Bradyrhizobium sp. MOS001]